MAILNTAQYYEDQYNNTETDYADLMYKNKTLAPTDNRMGLNPMNPKTDGNINTPYFSNVDESNFAPVKNYYSNSNVVSTEAQKNISGSALSGAEKINAENSELKATPTASNNIDTGKSFGGKVADNAGGIANFGGQVFQGFTTTAASDKQADMRTASLAVSGATLGLTVGGPWGALIGAAVGAGAGMLMKVPDRKKRLKKSYGSYEGKIFDEINQRKTTAEDFQKAQEIEQLMDLKKAQMGLINLKY